MPTYYLITQNMPGYLPESDPYVFECNDEGGNHIPQVLKHIYDEVEDACDKYCDWNPNDTNEWMQALGVIEADIENAHLFSEEGFSYTLPDGYVIEAILKTRPELVELGYEDQLPKLVCPYCGDPQGVNADGSHRPHSCS